MEILEQRIKRQQNILISGGTASGKTTLLNALAAFIPDECRLITIEDTAEIRIERDNLVRFEARREHADLPAVTIRSLLRASLRHRPDRIILGEVRGGESLRSSSHSEYRSFRIPFHHSCQLGRAGDRSLHQLRPSERRGASLYGCSKQHIAGSIDLLLHMERRRGKRQVTEVLEIKGYDPAADRHRLKVLFSCREDQQ